MSRETEADGFFAAIGKGIVGWGCMTVVLPLAAIPLAAYGALFYLPLWRWFAVPLGAPDMAFWQFIGLRLLWNAMMPSSRIKPEYERPFNEYLQASFIYPIAAWGLGAIIHFWLV